jgi:hypothetical protein
MWLSACAISPAIRHCACLVKGEAGGIGLLPRDEVAFGQALLATMEVFGIDHCHERVFCAGSVRCDYV